MNNLFSPNSKFMQLGAKLFDLISLQMATLLFSLPILTAGAAFTAMHRVLLLIYRDECSFVWREFFSSFRSNFKQSTGMWLIILALIAVFFVDIRLIVTSTSSPLHYLLLIPGVYFLLGLSWLFVLQSRYTNTVLQTIKNALTMVVLHPLYTIINVVLMLLPLALLVLSYKAIPVIFFLGYTLPGILRAILYSKIFHDLEGTGRPETAEE